MSASRWTLVPVVLLSATPLLAQSIVDGQRIQFLPSADNDTVVAGVALVQGYALNVYVAGSSTVVSTADLGKPTPDSDGYMRVGYLPLLTTPLQAGVTYESRVVVTGPGGSASSDVSNTFMLTSVCETSTIAPGSVNIGPGASAGAVAVTSTCPWSAISNAPWITITGATTGSASGTVAYVVAANSTSSPLAGTITIAGNTFTIAQAGVTCSYTLSSNQAVTADGGTGTVTVTTGSTCPWTSISNASWLTVISGASGTGSGTIAFSAAGNTGATQRSGTITVGGQTFTVTESACSYTVTPTAINVGYAATSASLSVTTSASCAWSAATSAPWATIGSGGTGIGTVTYSLAANTQAARTTNLTVAGQTISVIQGGLTPPGSPTNLRVIRNQ